MTEHEHDEIARRLRETGTVPAPERLRAEVMDQVRAEPKLRPSRRPFLMPVLPYAAAAAAVLAVLALALSHLGGGSGSNGSVAGGGGATAADSRAAPSTSKDALGQTPEASAAGGGGAAFNLSSAALQRVADAPDVKAHMHGDTVILAVPSSRLHHYEKQLGAIERRTRGDDTVRVVLQPRR
jgi:hypothetical protein